jgi:predicted membrane channel-forming protein YqfA (hemolysin III family)
MVNRTTFWDEVLKTGLSIAAAFCIAGIILGLIFSKEARIAFAIIVVFVGISVVITVLRRLKEL